LATCSLLAFPFPVIAILFLGSYSVIGMSLESQAAMATPCARPNNIDYVLAKERASIAISSGCVYRLIQWFVQNDFSF
jgi:hypothetical protein